MSPKKTLCSASKKGGIHMSGVRSEKTQVAYDTAVTKVKDNWGVTTFTNIFPPSIRPEQELGYSAVSNLKSISLHEKDLSKVQLLMLEECRDESGHVVKFGFKHTETILKIIKASRAYNAGKISDLAATEKADETPKQKKIVPAIDISKANKFKGEKVPPEFKCTPTKRGLEPDEGDSNQVAKKTKVTIPPPVGKKPTRKQTPDSQPFSPLLTCPAWLYEKMEYEKMEHEKMEHEKMERERVELESQQLQPSTPAKRQHSMKKQSPDSPPYSPLLTCPPWLFKKLERERIAYESQLQEILDASLARDETRMREPSLGSQPDSPLPIRPDVYTKLAEPIEVCPEALHPAVSFQTMAPSPTSLLESPSVPRAAEHFHGEEQSVPSSPLASFSEPSPDYPPWGLPAACYFPATPVVSPPIPQEQELPFKKVNGPSGHQENKPSAAEDRSFMVSRQEHRRLCDELFARIAGWQKMLDERAANK